MTANRFYLVNAYRDGRYVIRDRTNLQLSDSVLGEFDSRSDAEAERARRVCSTCERDPWHCCCAGGEGEPRSASNAD